MSSWHVVGRRRATNHDIADASTTLLRRHHRCTAVMQIGYRRAITETNATLVNEAAIARLVGAILLEQNDEWAELAKVPAAKQVGKPAKEVQQRYVSLEILAPGSDDPTISLSAAAARER